MTCLSDGCKNDGQDAFGGRCYFHRDQRGLYRKFTVVRTDGTSEPGRKHAGCTYFVLDWLHDPFAVPAAIAYADACEKTHPELASDLRKRAVKPAGNL